MAKLKWWQEAVVYQIYPRSFQDTNDDGIGDIPGIMLHLDELQQLGISVLWLSPVYPSPNADNGYDISNYLDIHPDFGTMSDMERLIDEAAKRGMRIIMDLVINHTSDEHPWFQQSRDKDSPYRDYYIWKPGSGKKKPNNWTGFFGGDCWEYDEKSGEYYLHLFAKKQPDLNYKHPKVFEEIKNIMRFWLDKGIAGFRCDVINIIYKESLENGKKKLILTGSEHYLSQEGAHRLLKQLREEVLLHYDAFLVGETVFVNTEQGRALCEPERGELDMIFSFEHMEADQWLVKWFKRRLNHKKLFSALTKWQKALSWNANYLENHDQLRAVSRFGNTKQYWEKSSKMLAILNLTLRGTPFLYQGQEIGMTNANFTSMADIEDVESHNINQLLKSWHVPSSIRWSIIRASSRDHTRTPMQWTDELNAGFTQGKPWLGINANHKKINLKNQSDDPNSIFNFYKKLIELRRETEGLLSGAFEVVQETKEIYVYRRRGTHESYLILLNFTDKEIVAEYKGVVLVSNDESLVYNGRLMPFAGIIVKENSEE